MAGSESSTDQPDGQPAEHKTAVRLTGVPETLLWTLYQRATEARRPDTVLPDPKAVALVDAIDYPFERFGGADMGQAQWQALRARCFDQQVRRFLDGHPQGTVVALGEGLETQFWRMDNGQIRWLTVDLPEVIDLRRRLLPTSSPRQRTLCCSALDPRWMDEVDTGHGVLVTAQGLLMYLQPSEVHALVAACARRFPGGALLLDAVPRWFSVRTLRGQMRTPGGYQAPPMPWGLDNAEKAALRAAHPNVVEVRRLHPPRGRGVFHGALMPLASRVPVLREALLTVLLVRFGSAFVHSG